MKVYTYYEPVAGWPREGVMDLWQSTWADHGWEPVILSRKDAEQHPQHDAFMSVVSTLPTVNDRRYEDECYRRHLAYQRVAGDGSVFTDYDVLNLGLKPQVFSQSLVSLAHGINTCAFWADRIGMDKLLLYIYGSNQIRSDTHNSDMTIFQSIHLKDPVSACYDLDDPVSGLLLHLSNRSCQPRSRTEWLPAVRAMLRVQKSRDPLALREPLIYEGDYMEARDVDELKSLWPKARGGSVFCVHDYNLPGRSRNRKPWTEGVFWAVNQFIAEQKIPLSFVHTWECGTVVLVKP